VFAYLWHNGNELITKYEPNRQTTERNHCPDAKTESGGDLIPDRDKRFCPTAIPSVGWGLPSLSNGGSRWVGVVI